MPPKYLQELIKNLQEFYKCPSCEAAYNFADIKFLGEIDRYFFVQLSCHECSLPMLATMPAGGGVVKGRRSDLKQSEEAKFAAKGAISAGEIAEFHRSISKAGFKNFN